MSDKNPLLEPQREKVGAETSADYAYQYHWALYRAIQEQNSQKEYAVFVELHEDVIVCDSLDGSKASFQLNQVKTTRGKFTTNALIKLKNGKSVLGKLIGSGSGKSFSSQISEMNFVATSGFGFKLKKPDITLTTITLEDIDHKDLSAIGLAIKNELSIDPLPTNLQFVIPEMPDKTFQHYIIAEISTLITTIYPNSSYNSVDIYRILIDELNRKGQVTYDFANWSALLKNKALTSITVNQVINQYTNLKDEAKVEGEYNAIAAELKLRVMESKSFKQCFDRYRQMRIGNRTVLQLDTSKSIKSLIKSNWTTANDDMQILIDSVCNNLDDNIKRNFPSDLDLKAAIICEFIMEDI